MKNLTAIIKKVEDGKRKIEEIRKLINYSHKANEAFKVSGRDGYHAVVFSGDRAKKIEELLTSFYEEDHRDLQPAIDTVNTLSDLIGDKHD